MVQIGRGTHWRYDSVDSDTGKWVPDETKKSKQKRINKLQAKVMNALEFPPNLIYDKRHQNILEVKEPGAVFRQRLSAANVVLEPTDDTSADTNLLLRNWTTNKYNVQRELPKLIQGRKELNEKDKHTKTESHLMFKGRENHISIYEGFQLLFYKLITSSLQPISSYYSDWKNQPTILASNKVDESVDRLLQAKTEKLKRVEDKERRITTIQEEITENELHLSNDLLRLRNAKNRISTLSKKKRFGRGSRSRNSKNVEHAKTTLRKVNERIAQTRIKIRKLKSKLNILVHEIVGNKDVKRAKLVLAARREALDNLIEANPLEYAENMRTYVNEFTRRHNKPDTIEAGKIEKRIKKAKPIIISSQPTSKDSSGTAAESLALSTISGLNVDMRKKPILTNSFRISPAEEARRWASRQVAKREKRRRRKEDTLRKQKEQFRNEHEERVPARISVRRESRFVPAPPLPANAAATVSKRKTTTRTRKRIAKPTRRKPTSNDRSGTAAESLALSAISGLNVDMRLSKKPLQTDMRKRQRKEDTPRKQKEQHKERVKRKTTNRKRTTRRKPTKPKTDSKKSRKKEERNQYINDRKDKYSETYPSL